MKATSKEELLQDAQLHLRQTSEAIGQELPILEAGVNDIEREMKRDRSSASTLLSQNLLAIKRNRVSNLKDSQDSPYFARCDVLFPDQPEKEDLYFGKFSLPELNIYSWASAAARIRFNKPGSFTYESETGKHIDGVMHRVDQYTIAQQQIRFMATETNEMPRTLIYQERFSNYKSEFVLPEIVERMEKAQDDIIRASAFGSFLISGPAGSGKTTLALHRIAYLLQSPEHAASFDPRKIMVLVQDRNSKEYFETLLPSLGIRDVGISTFDIWAMDILGIVKASYTTRYGTTESERDLYEASKHIALQDEKPPHLEKNHFLYLERLYTPHFSEVQKKLFAWQRKEKILDRFDLTILLQAQRLHAGALSSLQKVYSTTARGGYKSRLENVEVKHSLILVDEVQNYLPEQIHLLQSCISDKTKAMTYVGDLAQQTSLFTLRDWSSVGERFEEGRSVQLYKVYRSTRQILEYIQSTGFEIDIPEGIREGSNVKEHIVSNIASQQLVSEIVKDKKEILIGIIGLRPEDILPYRTFGSETCRVMTAVEAQGLEFDLVIFILDEAAVNLEYTNDLQLEKRKVIRDQIYVALTRAMNELYVLSEVPLRDLLNKAQK